LFEFDGGENVEETGELTDLLASANKIFSDAVREREPSCV